MNTFFMLKPFPIVVVCVSVWALLLWSNPFVHIRIRIQEHTCIRVLVPNIVSSSLSRSLSNSFNRCGYLKISETIVMHSSSALARSLSLSLFLIIKPFCNVIIRRKRRHHYTRQNVYRVSAIRGCSQRLYTYLFSNVKCQPFQMHSRVRFPTCKRTETIRMFVHLKGMSSFFVHGGQRANTNSASSVGI